MKLMHNNRNRIGILVLACALFFSASEAVSLFAESHPSHLRAKSAAQDGNTKDLLRSEIQEGGKFFRDRRLITKTGLTLFGLAVGGSTLASVFAFLGCDEKPTAPVPSSEIHPADIPYSIEESSEKAYLFLEGQIAPSGLVRSYAGKDASHLYNNGQLLSYFSNIGAVVAARKIGDALVSMQDQYGSWSNTYDLEGTPIHRERYIGAQAVAARGLLDLYEATGEPSYLNAARKTAGYILELQSNPDTPLFGSIQGGRDAVGSPYSWTSTEHNARALMFLFRLWQVETDEGRKVFYAKRTRWIADWLTQKMWNKDHFEVGLLNLEGDVNVSDTMMADAQYLPVIALGLANDLLEMNPASYNSLPWLLKYLTTVPYNGKLLHGFSIHTTSDLTSFWSEGTAGAAAAAQVLGNRSLAERLLLSLRFIQRESGALPSVIGEGGGSYPHHDPVDAVDATVSFRAVLHEMPLAVPDGGTRMLERSFPEQVSPIPLEPAPFLGAIPKNGAPLALSPPSRETFRLFEGSI
ncbi:MAG: hypothetical protein ABH845_03175 [Candidatus Omnitrophota bacterium]